MTPEKPFKKITKCICPNCEKEHTKKIHWIGIGTPKKYCLKCAKTSNISELTPNSGSSKQKDHHFYGVE
jgi:hypothetical protein